MAVALRPGDNNDVVRLLRARLNRDYPLYSNLVVDGIYGPRTTDPDRASQRIYTPDQFRSRTYDFVLNGDMYATATDDTLLHLGYEALTPLELDLPFALKIFTLIQSNEFLALLNLANTPENFAKVIRTSIVVGDFLIRNPHIHYGDWPDFNGVTGVDRAVQIVATGSTGGP